MKKYISLFLTIICLLSLACGCGKKQNNSGSDTSSEDSTETVEVVDNKYIVNGGKTEYSIVIPENSTLTENFAASELQSFINESAGAKLDIERSSDYNASSKYLCIGNVSFLPESVNKSVAALGTDGFVIKTVRDSVFIVGQNEAGTLYGVYDLVERLLGVRFLADDYTYVPEISSLSFYNLDIEDTPVIPRRYYWAGGATGDTAKSSLFNARCRIASNYGSGAVYGSETNWCLEAGVSHNICVLLVKPEEYEAEHPEFFYHEHGLTDICWSNGLTDSGEVDESMDISVFKVALNELKTYASNSTENVDTYMFGHWDVGAGNKGCQCARCRALQDKYGYAGMQIRFVNKLAEELNAWSLRELKKPAYVVCWAYGISSAAPVKETSNGGWEPIDSTVKANDNVIIYFAPIKTNRDYALLDKRQDISAYNSVSQWKAVANNFVVWTYDVNFAEYMIYWPRLQTYREDVKLFQEMGVKFILVQANWDTNNIWFTMMEKYVAAKLMWDPDKDVNALKNEWISLYYGPAGNEINELVRRYEEMWFPLSEENPSFHLRYSDMSETLANQASLLLLGLQGLCDEGIAKINSSSLSETEKNAFIRRVEGVKLTFMFLELDQYEIYHHTSLSGRYDLAVKVFDLAEKLGIDKYCEGTKFDTLRSTYL